MDSIKRDAVSRQIYKAAIQDDWDSVTHIFEAENWRLNAEISLNGETPLYIAVGTNSSHRFVEKLVNNIMTVGGGVQMLRVTKKVGRPTNALHMAGTRGNCRDAKILVLNDPDLPQSVIADDGGTTPLELAAWKGHEETVRFLMSVTRDEIGVTGTSPFRGTPGANLLTHSIARGLYDVALYLVMTYPDLVAQPNYTGSETAFNTLAAIGDAFPSGSQLTFWQRIVNTDVALYLVMTYPDLVAQPNYTGSETAFNTLAAIGDAFPSGSQLTFWQRIVNTGLDDTEFKVADIENGGRGHTSNLFRRCFGKGQAIHTAVRHGNHEFIEECIRNYPELIRYEVEGLNLFKAAINHPQEKVFNLLYQISAHALDTMRKVDGETALHLSAKLAPYHRLRTVTGAALQMQRELLWFKEVAKFVEPAQREHPNLDGKTPKMLFMDEHKQLLIDAQQWMQGTSSSSTVVAALLVTIAFAALFTVPGGNKDCNGEPLFLNDAVFLVFAISDAIALFSSSTSVLMFLSTLTHSSQEDFLYALPLRLTLGLVSLFISLAATMIAFSATLVLLLRDKIQWIAVPVTLMACVPVILFLWLQYPLLHELVRATFGKNIFGKQKNLLLH